MRIAVITGASSGLGKEYGRYIDRHFDLDEIWLIARREDRLRDLSGELHTKCRILPLDLCMDASIDALDALFRDTQPEIEILVNAAGFGKIGNYQDITRTDADRMIRLNCQAMMDVTNSRIRVTCVCPYWIKDTEFIAISRVDTEHPNAIRHFPLSGTAKSVVSQSMFWNRLYLPVVTPGIFATVARIWNKVSPKELSMLLWEGIRRL